uniref:Uncharacterized protein n=1 Tax=Cannabis sativa TaxID=3483 RepID=A0A803PL81_CANSA
MPLMATKIRRIASSRPQSQKWRLQFFEAEPGPLSSTNKERMVQELAELGTIEICDSESTVSACEHLVHSRQLDVGGEMGRSGRFISSCSRSRLTTTMHDLEVAGTQVNSERTSAFIGSQCTEGKRREAKGEDRQASFLAILGQTSGGGKSFSSGGDVANLEEVLKVLDKVADESTTPTASTAPNV